MTFSELINTDKPVLIDFYADWCAPCRAMKPVLEEVKGKMGDDVVIYKINVDSNEALSAKYQVRSIPTFILFRNGEAVWRQAGMVSARDLERTIREAL